jgi:anti-sigma factor RsiW
MTCATLRERLADLIAGELPSPERAEADAHLASCADCRRTVAELSAAEQMLRAGSASPAQAESAVRGLVLPRGEARQSVLLRFVPIAIRYAAVIVLGFVGGYLTRGPSAGAPTSPPTGAGTVRVTDEPLVNPAIVARYQAAEATFPAAPRFSRSLLALARP